MTTVSTGEAINDKGEYYQGQRWALSRSTSTMVSTSTVNNHQYDCGCVLVTYNYYRTFRLSELIFTRLGQTHRCYFERCSRSNPIRRALLPPGPTATGPYCRRALLPPGPTAAGPYCRWTQCLSCAGTIAPYFIVTNGRSLVKMTLGPLADLTRTRLNMAGMSHINSVACDGGTETIYWADTFNKAVYRGGADGANQTAVSSRPPSKENVKNTIYCIRPN